MNGMKMQKENPNGLYKAYSLSRIVPTTDEEKKTYLAARGLPGLVVPPQYKLEDTKPEDEFFVLKPNGKGDSKHIYASLLAINVYAALISGHIPKLAADIEARWPLDSATKKLVRKVLKVKWKKQ